MLRTAARVLLSPKEGMAIALEQRSTALPLLVATVCSLALTVAVAPRSLGDLVPEAHGGRRELLRLLRDRGGQRHHGALPSGELPVLEAHLSACASCRAYQAAAQAMDLRLGEQARAASQEVEWKRIERSVRGGLRSGIRFLLYDLLVGAVAIPAAALAFGRAGHRLALAAVVAAAVAVPVLAWALYLTWSARRTAELQ